MSRRKNRCDCCLVDVYGDHAVGCPNAYILLELMEAELPWAVPESRIIRDVREPRPIIVIDMSEDEELRQASTTPNA